MYADPEATEGAEAEALANSDEAASAGEGDEDREAGGPQRIKVAARMAVLRQRGIEIDEWIAEEFTNIEKQIQQLRSALLQRKQPIVWFSNAREVMDAFDRGVIKDKNEARKLLGLAKAPKRKQPAHLAAAQARRRGVQS